ncbi:hypothetical protein CLOSTASPAR_03627 [[Clostridium] asparagiforme DSM 15981]|uniref:Uncharacterized protein n=1 Tax=[Clostridium] asparagiforme DSM 15981 TaxID=518636 RepID=C0D2Y7_9FIRM|nr:hypothetical protein CLOSTASPAR_03627 [[Clostridium] asparagiforme DSM 15981]
MRQFARTQVFCEQECDTDIAGVTQNCCTAESLRKIIEERGLEFHGFGNF